MQLEVEQKFYVSDAASLLASLDGLGAAPGEAVWQIDTYYRHPSRDFAATDEALRIRRVGQRNYLTYKGPKLDNATKTRHEIELSLGDGKTADAFATILEALGFQPVAEVCKSRRSASVPWQGTHVEASLDEVQGLGAFVELELVTDEAGFPAARDCLLSLASELHLERSERRSYLELLLGA